MSTSDQASNYYKWLLHCQVRARSQIIELVTTKAPNFIKGKNTSRKAVTKMMAMKDNHNESLNLVRGYTKAGAYQKQIKMMISITKYSSKMHKLTSYNKTINNLIYD